MATLCQYCDQPHLTSYYTKVLHLGMWYRQFAATDPERNDIGGISTMQNLNHGTSNYVLPDVIHIGDNAVYSADVSETHEYVEYIEYAEDLPDYSSQGPPMFT